MKTDVTGVNSRVFTIVVMVYHHPLCDGMDSLRIYEKRAPYLRSAYGGGVFGYVFPF